jgi:hypothetical protein
MRTEGGGRWAEDVKKKQKFGKWKAENSNPKLKAERLKS